MLYRLPHRPQHYWLSGHSRYPSLYDYKRLQETQSRVFIIANWKRACSSPATLIFRSSHSFITLSSSALYFFSLVHYIISPTSITLSITSRMFFFVFKFYSLQKRCSLNVLNMILETPSFKVTNIIFESYEHRSKIILQLLKSFVFLKVGCVPHMRIYSWFKHITTVNC